MSSAGLAKSVESAPIPPTVGPQSVAETGVQRSFLDDLALKTLFLQGEVSLRDLASQMRLSLGAVEELFLRLRREQLCEVKGMVGGIHRIVASEQGRARAQELLSLNQYVGPAPVSWHDYVSRVEIQSVRNTVTRPDDVERAFSHLVLSDHTLKQLGTAIVSGTSIFLHGPPGTGKTAIAEALPRVYGEYVWIPYAVEVDGQIIAIYDSGLHHRTEELEPEDGDRRWVLCRRPCVVSGGELSIEMLDLQFNPVAKYYSAPLQMKANNGVLVIDDFGRQRVRPEELLNRWIVPLDRRVDYLTLVGGRKFAVPFDLLVVFATNLEPTKLADEAFLRRIQNKVKVDSVSALQFQEILRRACAQFNVHCDEEMVRQLTDLVTKELKQPLRPCYARDLMQQICWEARYEGKTPRLTPRSVARACASYFLPAPVH